MKIYTILTLSLLGLSSHAMHASASQTTALSNFAKSKKLSILLPSNVGCIKPSPYKPHNTQQNNSTFSWVSSTPILTSPPALKCVVHASPMSIDTTDSNDWMLATPEVRLTTPIVTSSPIVYHYFSQAMTLKRPPITQK